MSKIPEDVRLLAQEALVRALTAARAKSADAGIAIIARALMAADEAADEAATKRERERMGWQPIETAPKDGEGFLAYWPISETQWCIVTCWWKTTGAAGPGWHTVDLFDDDSERLILPTKWQPLPPPPAHPQR